MQTHSAPSDCNYAQRSTITVRSGSLSGNDVQMMHAAPCLVDELAELARQFIFPVNG